MDEFRLYNRALSATEVAAIAGNICLCYIDADGDGYGDAEGSGIEPEESGCPTGTVGNNKDCNDNVNPGQTEPVSYTHLDVYKRQLFFFTQKKIVKVV